MGPSLPFLRWNESGLILQGHFFLQPPQGDAAPSSSPHRLCPGIERRTPVSAPDDDSSIRSGPCQTSLYAWLCQCQMPTSSRFPSSWKEPLAPWLVLLSTPGLAIIPGSFLILVLWSQSVPSMPLRPSFLWPPLWPCHHLELLYLWNHKSEQPPLTTSYHFSFQLVPPHLGLFQQDLQYLDSSVFFLSINPVLFYFLPYQTQTQRHITSSLS